jgi:hypothetical protein
MSATELRFGNYRVWELDARNVCLEVDTGEPLKDRDGNVKPGGETIKTPLGYYSGFPAALKSALQHGLKGRGATDAKKLMEHINASLAAIERAVATASDA